MSVDLRKVDLSGLSKTQLDALIKKAEKQKKAPKAAAKTLKSTSPGIKKIADEIAKVAKKEGVTKQEVVEAVAKRMRMRLGTKPTRRAAGAKPGAKRGKVAPKYRHPDDASLTWAGRGKRPNWLEAELKKGKKVEDFLIK